MIDLPKEIEDRHSYPLVAPEYRWIYNKLAVAEKFGYRCAPSGTPMTQVGWYCIRPIYNAAGAGFGGHIKFFFDGQKQPDHIPGWFWCEWFNGYHEWCDYTDDQPVQAVGGHLQGNELRWAFAPPRIPVLPQVLQGISKHLLVESIGGNIIEISPRHQVFIGPQLWSDPVEPGSHYAVLVDIEPEIINTMRGKEWQRRPYETSEE